jgi:hypothetical protein
VGVHACLLLCHACVHVPAQPCSAWVTLDMHTKLTATAVTAQLSLRTVKQCIMAQRLPTFHHYQPKLQHNGHLLRYLDAHSLFRQHAAQPDTPTAPCTGPIRHPAAHTVHRGQGLLFTHGMAFLQRQMNNTVTGSALSGVRQPLTGTSSKIYAVQALQTCRVVGQASSCAMHTTLLSELTALCYLQSCRASLHTLLPG